MTDRMSGGATQRLEARLERWFETEVHRAERDLRAGNVSPTDRRIRSRRFASARGMLVAAASLILVGATLSVGVALVGWLGPIGSETPGGATVSTSPSHASAPTPTTNILDLTIRYPDGIPSTFGGEHVYRPSDLLGQLPRGPFLLGGWTEGDLLTCLRQAIGPSSPPCPAFEGLAETRGGPSLIALSFGETRISGFPAVVLRVAALPATSCVSIPGGGCSWIQLDVQDVLWFGDPGAGPRLTP